MPDTVPDSTSEKKHRRIRSFVRREGRLTKGQQRALTELWVKFGLNNESTSINLKKIFGRAEPKVLEIGFGNGASLVQMAATHTDHDYLGIEVHRPGVGALLLMVEDQKLSNIRVICDDAVEVLKHRIEDGSLDRVQLFFPDPWHKKRHHKRRIVQPDFVSLIAKKLKPGGCFHLATDWEDYAFHMAEVMKSSVNFTNTASDGDFVARPDFRPLTKFEQRGQRLGHGVWDLIYQKN
ncbi:MAG: tRNA (guanosine(46)-N7)-methyltransferase TrmB [Gammaproteobacteria bacterium]